MSPTIAASAFSNFQVAFVSNSVFVFAAGGSESSLLQLLNKRMLLTRQDNSNKFRFCIKKNLLRENSSCFFIIKGRIT